MLRFKMLIALPLVIAGSAVSSPMGPAVAGTLACPSPRSATGMTYDAARDEIVMFGGYDRFGAKLDDTCTWDGSAWTLQTPPRSPAGRWSMGLTYDGARRKAVLFSGAAVPDSTLTWNGARWWRAAPADLSPGGRNGHGMVYDVARQEVVMFGGAADDGAMDLGDTWTWNGLAWTEETPAHSPLSRDRAPMAYDAARQEVLLFGGYGEGGFREDTWTWDGTTWTKESPPMSPPDGGAFLAYDAARREVVAWAGTDGTWTWDGMTWTKESPLSSPTDRADPALAYDFQNEVVWLFSGVTEQADYLNDLWAWDGENWTKQPRCQAHDGSAPPTR